MDIKSSASSQLWIYQIQHPQAMISRVEWRMIWIWNHKQDHSNQHVRMHNSQTMIARVGWRMDIKPSAWSSLTCKNIQLTPYNFQSKIKMNMWSSIWSQSPICKNTKLTCYDCQCGMKNGHGIISMIRVINIPESTHFLWLPEQIKNGIDMEVSAIFSNQHA